MAGGGTGNADEPISNINVTPLVDIMLVLVIILMVTAEFTKFSTVGVKLPKVNAVAAETEPYKVVIKALPDGMIEVGRKKFALKSFSMKDYIDQEEKKAQAQKKLLSVVIDADDKVDYVEVLNLADAVNALEIERVGLAVKKIN